MAELVARHFKAIAAVGIAVVAAALFLAFGTSHPGDSTATSSPQTVFAAPAIRPWPTSKQARARLTPNLADQAMLDQILLTDHFEELLKRARKDPVFAHSLAFSLHQCKFEDRSLRWLDVAVRVGDAQRDRRAIERHDSTFAKCQGLKPAQSAKRFELAEQAARAGVLEAQLYYRNYVATLGDREALRTSSALGRYRQNAEAFTVAAAHSGDRRALYSAYQLYEGGILVPRDLVRAYRYAEQYVRLDPSEYSQGMLDSLTRRMTPDELRRAQTGG